MLARLASFLLRVDRALALRRARPRHARLKRGEYRGRLAWDSDGGFHIDEKGRRVLTDDGGKTWRYAKRKDTSHVTRYHQRDVVVDSTQNAAALGQPIEPHHLAVQPDDDHYDPASPSLARLKRDPDEIAAVVTGHTDAWREG